MAANAKHIVKVGLRQIRRRYIETFHAFSARDLAQALIRVGIAHGDVLLVHSSYDAFQGFSGKPTDVIAALQGAVGSAGALLMPTLPFTGVAVDYAHKNPVFDVRRSPSQTGLLTEIFRRSPGVLRSVHPTHPVAVAGRDAAEFTAGHHLAGTPCGRDSPYTRLLDRNGKILLLGTDISVLTFYHAIEELLEKQLPFSPFTTEVFTLQSRDYSGNIVTTRTRLFERAVSRRRNLYKLVPELRQSGAWRNSTAGRVSMVVLRAEDVLATAQNLANKGTYCYD